MVFSLKDNYKLNILCQEDLADTLMKKEIIIVQIIIVIMINLFGCGSSERADFRAQYRGKLSRENQKPIGMPNPSALYCTRLGYNLKIFMDDKGGQYGVCIFPDNSECRCWDFYRGKCGQEWSYCKQCGYELKELGQRQGWIKGSICIDKSSKKELGNVFDLFLSEFLSASSP